MPWGIPRRGRVSTLARAGGIAGLLVYLVLPLAAAMPRSGRSGSVDRGPGIVLARYRQAQADMADDRPLPRPSTPALPPACVPAVVAPGRGGCATASVGDAVGTPPLREQLSRGPPVR